MRHAGCASSPSRQLTFALALNVQQRDTTAHERAVRMNITTTFRHMDGTDAVKQYAQDKVGKLQRFLRQDMRADVTMMVQGKQHVAELHVTSGPTRLHGSESSENMYASIDLVVDKLERQIRSVKGHNVQRTRHGKRAADVARDSERGARSSRPGSSRRDD